MQDGLQHINLEELARQFNIEDRSELAKEFIIQDRNAKDSCTVPRILDYPCRFDGYVAVFCVKGSFRCEIDLNQFEVTEGSLTIWSPANIVRMLNSGNNDEELRYVIVAASPSMVEDINFNLSKTINEVTAVMDNPCVKINQEEILILKDYFYLAKNLLNSDFPNIKNSLRYLISSIFCLLGGIWTEKQAKQSKNNFASSEYATRADRILDDFLKLVAEYHCTERDVIFYAEKLCLTPKYLSKLVKKQSGRSAPEWIDAYVILEAKNMLKYSDLNIKEIVYKLNFRSQPIFYRYFKAHTGMTPSEYRNS